MGGNIFLDQQRLKTENTDVCGRSGDLLSSERNMGL